ncbi:hypothetical protein F511_47127 [Dorcoceras hygrometricum]|uniref:Uncharacterized protein n=1 Tax=Dorcoceras hygrometricum TaxID=472368 RepID=A0A2Z6ZY80_9LAMI|nr:hypothetical protein F511_47127 [Dorcoceras hygrometricum]
MAHVRRKSLLPAAGRARRFGWLVDCAQVARRAGRPPFACDDRAPLVAPAGWTKQRCWSRCLRGAAAHDARRPRDVARGVVRRRRDLRGGGAGRRSGESPVMS